LEEILNRRPNVHDMPINIKKERKPSFLRRNISTELQIKIEKDDPSKKKSNKELNFKIEEKLIPMSTLLP
jgi:hypothetical protein